MDVKIIAHYISASEREAALRVCRDEYVTDAYVIGTVDDSQIPGLEAQGLIVQTIDQPTAERGPVAVEPESGEARPEGAPASSGQATYYVIRLAGPLLQEWRARLDELQAGLLERLPDDTYTARLTTAQLRQVQGLPFVADVRVYGAEETNPSAFEARTGVRDEARPEGRRAGALSDVLLHRSEDMGVVRRWLREHGVKVAGKTDRKLRVRLAYDGPLARELAGLPAVARLDPYMPPKLHNDVARQLLGVTDAHSNVGIRQTGAGQIVGIADTGIDETHPDFGGRIVAVIARGRRDNASDTHGHGTHVAGSVLSTGAASAGTLSGVAPQAKLFFQSLLDRHGGLGGLPVDLRELFEEAYAAEARIHNNSWGSATESTYTIDASEVDSFVASHRDMLVVISAGNAGTAANPINSKRGFVDWLSINSPASCKNALTVGASRSCRTAGGWSQRSYCEIWPSKYADSPIGDARVSGDPESIAAFSSRGPCDDRRIKPDVVAPGTDILSTRSSLAPRSHFWDEYPSNPRYAFMGGTSMAAPLVSGCAALVRQYLVAERGHEPSAALLKAILINGTRWLTADDAIADHSHCPNYHQGFGAVYLPWSIPNEREPDLRLEFADTWREPGRQFGSTGQALRYLVTVRGGRRLRICLAYTDISGRAIQNNLNLFVQYLESGKKWIGNEQIRSDLRGPDRDNNVEIVRMDNPPVGRYLIQITATSLLHMPQDFALVVAGDLDGQLKPT